MLSTYQYPKYEYRKPPEFAQGGHGHRPVVVVGAGPVGLAAALELARAGVPVVVLDDDDTVSVGSRGVCYARRTLEVLDRIGIGQPCVDKGVSWNVGRTFFQQDEVYSFNLQPQADRKRPGMINLQQYYLEQYQVDAALRQPGLDLRFRNRLVALARRDAGVTLTVETPDGNYTLHADWLIAADGARSPIRRMLDLDIEGKVFMDRFLIADVVMKAGFPAERWFWFDPPFHRGQSVLLHRQADNVWRIDFQLGWQADPEFEKRPENVIPRIQAMLGDGREFELEWVSVYTFQCRRMSAFRHDRVLFIGDAAHQVSPFGARGANSGIQDSDNLCWKLRLVLEGKAPERLLDSYSDERVAAADENIMNSTRSTDFITPKSRTSLTFRNAVLSLAGQHAFARALVNSGRLSVPAVLAGSALNTPDGDSFAGDMVPGAPMDDAPIREHDRDAWLVDQAGGRFCALVYTAAPAAFVDAASPAVERLAHAAIPVEVLLVVPAGTPVPPGIRALEDRAGRVQQRYDASEGTTYLLRPDQHVAARWRGFDADAITASVARATGNLQ